MNESHTAETEPETNLIHNLVLFGRLLHRLGLEINPGRMIDLVEALNYVEIGRRADFYHTLRTLLVVRREDLPVFDQAFQLFWRQHGGEAAGMLLEMPGRARPKPKALLIPPPLSDGKEAARGSDAADVAEDETEPVIEVTRTYSARERLTQKDFAELTAEELAAVKALMSGLTWELGQRRTRRQRPGRGSRLDLRRSLRQNLRYGGELLHWSRRQPKVKPRPLVVLADISGSMERYSRLLVHFLYSLSAGLTQEVEVFLFGTRLTRISRQLHDRDVERALREVARAVPDWSGGTRIGEALKSFNYDWGRRVLKGGAVVLIISDGWDRGDPDLLSKEMARLQRSCSRLIWLNPLLGSPRYEPLTRGIQAALPFVDDFLPVHNLASLKDLALHLERLESKRPFRRQKVRPAAEQTAA